MVLLSFALLVLSVATESSSTLTKQTTNAGCKILFDGRIPLKETPEDFTLNTSVYNPTFILGQNQTFAQVLKFPVVGAPPPSMFDLPSTSSSSRDSTLTKPLLITIDDQSIFFPSPTTPQTGFRRTELIPGTNNGSDPTVFGTTTVHWSIRTDPSHPLNYTHEYHPVWHERNDFNGDHFDLETGTPFTPAKESIPIKDPKTLRIAGFSIPTPEENVFITPFEDEVWHNFALEIGWDTNLTTVYYSRDYTPLQKVAGPFTNDNSDGGQFHFGFLKLPVGPQDINVVTEGFQEHIHQYEGLFYGGIFIEDSSDGCVTL